MIAFTFIADDAPQDRHHLFSAAPSVTGLAVNARGAVPADGTAGLGVLASTAPAGDPLSGATAVEETGADDLVSSAPLTGTVGYVFAFDVRLVQT